MKYYLEKEFKLLKKCRSRAERKAGEKLKN